MVTWTLPDPPPPAADLASLAVAWLQAHRNAENIAGMARFGIAGADTLGVPMSVLRPMARTFRPLVRENPDEAHATANQLWNSGIHEARILAGLIDPPELITPNQADDWVADFDSWDVCDQVCAVFARTTFAYQKAAEWSTADPVFTRRAGFVVIAWLAVHDKKADDEEIIGLLPLAVSGAVDDRNFVKKSVSWALRQVGKRSATCHLAALTTCEEILATHPDSRSARWVARDALRELRSDKVLNRIAQRSGGRGPTA